MITKILLISTSRMTLEQLNSEVDGKISLKEDDFTNSRKKAKSHYEVYPPLGLFYLSAMVKRETPEVKIKLYDLHFESIKASHRGEKVDWFEMCDSQIQAMGPDLIGLSTMFGASFDGAKNLGLEIKNKYSEMILVSGGVHITGLTKRQRDKHQLDFCDFICLNESESHFSGLIKYLNGQQDYLKGVIVNNQQLLRDEGHSLSGLESPDEIDELPIPDFGAVDIHNYYKYGILSGAQTIPYDTPLATMQTVRGCIARCSFCSVRSFNGLGVRMHSAERVLKEIDILYNQHGIRHIDFVDDDFTYSKQRVIDIAKGLIERNYSLTWSIGNGVRLGSLDDELLENMADAGCTYFSLGIESGDPKILKEMRKPLTIPMLKKGAQLLKRHPRIYYRANFITGYPGETMEQLQRTFSVAEEIEFDWCLFSMCKPLPDTELYNNLLENVPSYEGVGNSTSQDYSFGSAKGILSTAEDDEKDIFNLSYYNNLKINFKNNINLKGKNVQRAVKDFERITKIAQDHAFAWNCLAIGYQKLGMEQEFNQSAKKTKEIVKQDPFWQEKFEELEFEIISS